MGESELRALEYDWWFWARAKQWPPEDYWFVWFVMAGRGFGKTRTGAEWVRAGAETRRFARMALVAETPADARDVMVNGPAGILSVCPPWDRPHYEPTKRLLTWPGREDWLSQKGPEAHIYSGHNPDLLRGPEHDEAWVDELAKYPYAQDSWDNLLFGLRGAHEPHVLVTTTPRPIALIHDLVKRDSTRVVTGSSYENRANLSETYYREVIAPYEGTTLGQQEIHAKLLLEVPGSLWTRKLLTDTRVPRERWQEILASAERVVVALDPPAKSTERSAECGIVVACKGRDGHGYLLHDGSKRASPSAWARATLALFDEYDADRIIYEENQGGEMVENTLRVERAHVPLKGVNASRSKEARAEPVSALFEKGTAHLVGTFDALEDQLCGWVPGSGRSPDRLDAMVWAFTELLVGGQYRTNVTLPRLMRGDR